MNEKSSISQNVQRSRRNAYSVVLQKNGSCFQRSRGNISCLLVYVTAQLNISMRRNTVKEILISLGIRGSGFLDMM